MMLSTLNGLESSAGSTEGIRCGVMRVVPTFAMGSLGQRRGGRLDSLDNRGMKPSPSARPGSVSRVLAAIFACVTAVLFASPAGAQSGDSGVKTITNTGGGSQVEVVGGGGGGGSSGTGGSGPTGAQSGGGGGSTASGGGSSGGGSGVDNPGSGTQIIGGKEAPSDPAAVQVEVLPNKRFRVSWQDMSSVETGFQIERMPPFAAGIKRVAPDSTEFIETVNADRVRYRVRALGTAMNSRWSEWVCADTIPTESFPILQPGTGFTGPTPQPPRVGAPNIRGSGAKAIARWDVVPFQDFTDDFHIGIVAFHINGIDRVEFSANGGPWVAVRQMQLNPRSGVWEYTAALRASDFPDGLLEVRAIVWPKEGGVPRVLAGPMDMMLDKARIRGEYSLFLNANADGTLPTVTCWADAINGSDETGDGSERNPFRTLVKATEKVQADHGATDGATIYLKAGEYVWGQTSNSLVPQTENRWMTISGAPQIAKEDVILSGTDGNGLRNKNTRLTRLTLTATPNTGAGVYSRMWADDIILRRYDLDPVQEGAVIRMSRFTGGVWFTDCNFHSMIRGPREFLLCRNADIHDIGGDAHREFRGLLVNSHVRDLLNLGPTHNDVMQFYSNVGVDPFENIIIYGLRAVDNIAGQSFFVATKTAENGMHRDWAVVNYLAAAQGSGGAQFGGRMDHFLLWNYQQLTRGFMIRDASEQTHITNFSVRDSVFNYFRMSHTGEQPNLLDQSWASNNHYIDMEIYQARSPGVRATTGGTPASLFVNAEYGDFRPRPESVLVNRVATPLVPADAAGELRGTSGSIGALAPPENP